MSEKDKANPRQRITMEERWEKARRDCAYERCEPAYRFHAAGCPRRTQKVKVTNLNTGQTSEATIVHGEFRAVKDVLDQHEKQAVKLEPVVPGVVVVKDVNDLTQDELDEMARVKNEGGVLLIPEALDFDKEYWDAFERGEPGARDQIQPPTTYMPPEPAPARPWWKFWGRRG